jgi:hypothetical protein
LIAEAIKDSVYADLEGQKLVLPADPSEAPNQEAIARRWKGFCGETQKPGEALA